MNTACERPERRTIVGIDPGTTTAWAVLDLEGNLLQLGSSKEVGLSSLISIISSFGRPIIVGCDKKKTPSLVDEFGRKCGARVISPNTDLKVEFKRGLCIGVKPENSHEMDALSSARFAHKEAAHLLGRVRKFISKESKPDGEQPSSGTIDGEQSYSARAEEIFETVLRSGISIKGAAALLDEEEEIATAEENGNAPGKKPRTVLSLLRAAQKEASLLREHILRLSGENQSLHRRIASLENQLIKRRSPNSKDPRIRDETLNSLRKRISHLESEHATMRKSLDDMRRILMRPSDHSAAIIMDNLSSGELDRAMREGPITTESMILVKHPTHANSKTIEHLREIQPLLLSDENVKNHPLPILCVRGLPRTEIGRIAIFKADSIRNQTREANLLGKVISDYRNERAAPKPGAPP